MDAAKIISSLAGAVALRFLDPSNETVVFYTRVAFVASFTLSFILMIALFLAIKCKPALRDHTVQVKEKSLADLNPLAGLINTNKKPVVPKTYEQTFEEYDMASWRRQFTQLVTSMAVAATLHLYFGYYPPIVLSAVVIPVSLLSSELVWLHLLCFPDKKELKRPWEDNQPSWSRMFKDLKKEMMQTMGKAGTARKNKRNENRRAVTRR